MINIKFRRDWKKCWWHAHLRQILDLRKTWEKVFWRHTLVQKTEIFWENSDFRKTKHWAPPFRPRRDNVVNCTKPLVYFWCICYTVIMHIPSVIKHKQKLNLDLSSLFRIGLLLPFKFDDLDFRHNLNRATLPHFKPY